MVSKELEVSKLWDSLEVRDRPPVKVLPVKRLEPPVLVLFSPSIPDDPAAGFCFFSSPVLMSAEPARRRRSKKISLKHSWGYCHMTAMIPRTQKLPHLKCLTSNVSINKDYYLYNSSGRTLHSHPSTSENLKSVPSQSVPALSAIQSTSCSWFHKQYTYKLYSYLQSE